ncbi:Spectrin alpha chain, erythrocyte [Cricetulus griseus]|uniref:Spectrin alpha chain, erythrocyte n=1 Tax=Cricetulus griseus TaxID=10029 RepID=G3H821_CRIGR|nr:Spectrin alpha chain, erythrocyte [Cricetulus griseus]
MEHPSKEANKHPKLPEIKAKQDEVNAAWDRLWNLALKRRENLSNAADLQRFKRYHRFLSDYDELSGWMKEKTALINADELPTDVASGEALLARHQQHKHEIDSYDDRFQSADATGQDLLDGNHEASEEIREKMTKLANDWAALLELWDKCQHQYRQCLDFHLFYRDSEQVDSWMSRQEITF